MFPLCFHAHFHFMETYWQLIFLIFLLTHYYLIIYIISYWKHKSTSTREGSEQVRVIGQRQALPLQSAPCVSTFNHYSIL